MLRAFHIAALCLCTAGCASLGYYAQAVSGHMDLMRARQPIDELVAADNTPAALKDRLKAVRVARSFAVTELALPDNGSYRTYVALDRPAVVWNVFAAPEFSLEPKQWCFPVAGCVVYRGYFSLEEAREYAAGLAEDGYDTWVGGAAAYSTLGRFEDPVLSTMLVWDDARLAGILFHELAHQRLYLKDDSAFNEAFASAVEEEGVRRWLESQGMESELAAWRRMRDRTIAFEHLLERTTARLQEVYRSGASPDVMRARKAAAFEALRSEYEALRAEWGGWTEYDVWFQGPLNNARLVLSATYRQLVPAFRALLQRSGGDLEAFYRRSEALAELPSPEREAKLGELLASVGSDPAAGAR